MVGSKLNEEYFEWMYQMVYNEKYSRYLSYRKLLRHLNDIEFTYIIDMDGNRAEDGINLRYQFGRDRGIKEPIITTCLDNRSCSVLEMMIALSIRCEVHIMDDPTIGDRTGQWFWNMIVNLGLGTMTDSRFDANYIDEVIYCFLNRRYSINGEGGLFTIKHCSKDLRNVEIWYQAMWYMDEILNN